MPYSQQFWHKYHDQATMLKVSRAQPVMMPYQVIQPTVQQTPGWVQQPSGLHVPTQQVMWPQSSQPVLQNTITVPASLPETLQPPSFPTNEVNQIQYRR